MNYSQTLEFLYGQLPMFSKIGSHAIKKGLGNIIELCHELGDPQNKIKTIHIAGTNGKGSVSHMLAAIFQTAGFKTGLYTSPHLVDFRERIKINGVMIPEDTVVEFVERINPAIDKLQPSFFEITVAMAFDHFANEQVDIAIIETGLGGRLDSTNIIHPILSVITNIAFDHTDILGNTLALIAGEKAGIIKHQTPVVIGQYLPETKEVFIQKALEEKAPIIFAEDEWINISHSVEENCLTIQLLNANSGESEIYELDLRGSYQTHNIKTVLSAIHLLAAMGWKLSATNIYEGIANAAKLTGLKGRWDIVQHNPLMVIDVGHNADGITEVMKQIHQTPHTRLHIVTGMVKDKDVDSVLQLMPTEAIYYFTKAQIPRALHEEILFEKACKYHLQGQYYTHISLAVKAAMESANKDDLIVVCGSVFVAGEAYQYLTSINNK